ncbi:MAG: glycosyltransferase [Gemmatimonadaceae bacterium]|nr:glycosyltransferase [Gemmatimonadaceae bacterium]
MTPPASLTLVVPCYNEARRLDSAAFHSALQQFAWLRLCFVNDGSTDASASLLEDLQSKAPTRIDVITLPRNGGKAEAVRAGLLHAAAISDYCGFWDADLSAPLTEIGALYAVFAAEPAVEWVFGIRLRSLGRHITRGALRHYIGRVFATLASGALGIGTYDTQCGAKLFRVTPLLRDVLSEAFLSPWVFDVEMLSRADALLRATSGAQIDAVIFEQPLRRWHHRGGSKVRPIDLIRASVDLFRIRGAQSRWRRALRTGTDTPASTHGAA